MLITINIKKLIRFVFIKFEFKSIKMKKNVLLLIAFLFSISIASAQVGIGTTEPDSSSVLDVFSNERGFLFPRLTTTQRNLINSPAEGLMIYNTTENSIEFFNGVGWYNLNNNTVTIPPSGPPAPPPVADFTSNPNQTNAISKPNNEEED